MIAYGTPFDNCNPPAVTFFEHGVRGVTGYTLNDEREWARGALLRHKAKPKQWSRPVVIVKLKAWKFAEPMPS